MPATAAASSSIATRQAVDQAAAPLSSSQVGYGLIHFELPFAILCSRCSAQHARATAFESTRRRIRGTEGTTQWSYSFTLECCRQSVEVRADAVVSVELSQSHETRLTQKCRTTQSLTYSVASGARAVRSQDENVIFDELRHLATGRTAADVALERQARIDAITATTATQQDEEDVQPTFATAPSMRTLAKLGAPSRYNYAPTSPTSSAANTILRDTRAASTVLSERTLLGGRPGERARKVEHQRLATLLLPPGTQRTSRQLRELYERERSLRDERASTAVKPPPAASGRGYSVNLERREGIGIGGTDGRGGGTSMYAPPVPKARTEGSSSYATLASLNEAAAQRTASERKRRASSVLTDSTLGPSASVRAGRRSAAPATPQGVFGAMGTTRERRTASLAQKERVRALGARLARRARRLEDPFEREMWESVERGRALGRETQR